MNHEDEDREENEEDGLPPEADRLPDVDAIT